MKEKLRENNYDLLRIISCVAVILIHISAIYFLGITDSNKLGQTCDIHHFYITFMNIIPRFSVPCFLMLSGAFILSNDKNSNRKYFYKKAIKSLFVPVLVVSIMYLVYKEIEQINNGGSIIRFWFPLKDALLGVSSYHLWYVSMLIGLYLIVPDIIKYVRVIEEKKKSNWIFAIFILFTVISGYHTKIIFHFGISSFVLYIGYFIAGYLIRKQTLNKNNNVKATLFLIAALILYIVQAIAYTKLNLWYSNNEMLLGIFGKNSFDPFVVLTSICTFYGFSYLKLSKKINFGNLPRDTFYIYLLHAFVVSIIEKILKHKIGLSLDVRIAIPLFTAITFIVSLILTKIYILIFNIINKGDKLENKFIQLLKLDKE